MMNLYHAIFKDIIAFLFDESSTKTHHAEKYPNELDLVGEDYILLPIINEKL